MSEPSSSAPGTAGTAKKPVSPARNIIGLIVLVGVLVFGWFEYSAKAGYNSAVNALNERMKDENLGLMTQPEAEKMIGKAPDDGGGDVQVGGFTYAKKTYTWKGLINTYTMAAYYTKGRDPALHHIEAGETFDPQAGDSPAPAGAGSGPPPSSDTPPPGPPMRSKGARGKSGKKAAPDEKSKADEKPKADAEEKATASDSKPDEKPKADADEKPGASEPKADEKPKADADEKAKAPAKEG